MRHFMVRPGILHLSFLKDSILSFPTLWYFSPVPSRVSPFSAYCLSLRLTILPYPPLNSSSRRASALSDVTSIPSLLALNPDLFSSVPRSDVRFLSPCDLPLPIMSERPFSTFGKLTNWFLSGSSQRWN